MSKIRKTLDESIAKEFVFGKDAQKVLDGTSPSSTENNLLSELPKLATKNDIPDNRTIMQKIAEIPAQKEAVVRFTVDLPESLHTKLSILAAQTKRKKSEIVRLLISDALENVDQ